MFKKNSDHIYLSNNYNDNLELFSNELGAEDNFDVIIRELKVAGRKGALIGIDGLIKDEDLLRIIQSLSAFKKESLFSNTYQQLLENIPYIEMETENQIDELLYAVLSGSVLLIIDGLEEAFVIDARTYPARDPDEPDIERVVRGSRDGFTETLVYNTALLRRRVRDPKLRIELINVGKRSKSDIAICYINDIADQALIEKVKDRIEQIQIDGIPMAEKSVEELIVPGNIWNPFPKVRYTERPDVGAFHLFEGHILIMVDTSPSVMIAPVTYFHHVQHAEEYRQNPSVGLYIRWIRFLAVLASVFVTPLWLLMALAPELLPDYLSFIGPEEVGNVPIFIQFLIAELALDLLRMSAIHTPSPLATALGIIAAILIGEIAIDMGLLVPEVILYTAIVAVGSYCTPSYEMAMANRLMRLFILIGTGLFLLPGFIVTTIIAIGVLLFTKSFNVPYLWPLIPFNYRAIKSILVRSPVPVQNLRPEILNTKDKSRQPK
ncbi:Stage V sporulation protein AF (SpoVAF) [Candidatus Syntrophocurvum alkaliphilum]|uniref:Stage V sporulation protein AF (SpoVAF) n=1 Tax=Candidatus Syntrophocurvum alkaliphilum TaxID=2293317 RepID=A0A6I6DE03_9FIRM|nr:spore germination protein [Candidatus Syntrophocurvum alkaliphilum]QGT99002.1 Stage V sporulation protein AF (SpoVAF) [Candidatus Syntrophocurvum alkaliphilum]